MNLIKLFINRPATLIAICIAIFLIGITSYLNLPKGQFPRFKSHLIYVTTHYPGASPEVLQGFVTQPILNALSSLDGVDYITASNQLGTSSIKVFLKYSTKTDDALSEVNSAVNSVLWRLPNDVNTPQIDKGRAGSPSIFLAVESNHASLAKISSYTTHIILPKIKEGAGISRVVVRGGEDYAMIISLNPLLLDAHNLTVSDVTQKLKEQHLQAAVGHISNSNQSFNLQVNSSLSSPQAFNNIVIKAENNNLIRIKDIGNAHLGHTKTPTRFITNKKNALFLSIYPQANVDIVKNTNTLIKKLKTIEAKLPENIHLKVIWNPTKFTEGSLKEVSKTLWEAIALIIFIILLFTGEFKAIFVPIMAIPLCLLSMAGLMKIFGFSINTMTLLSAVLAIGLVVDDAIVVLENTHRYILKGEKTHIAAFDSVKEMLLSIITMTLVVSIVFIPISLLTGITGTLVREFAITLSLMVLISGLVAVFISPSMCAHLLSKKQSKLTLLVNKLFTKFSNGYRHILIGALSLRYLIVILVVLLCGLSYILIKTIPTDLIPNEEQNVAVAGGDLPSQSSQKYGIKVAHQLKSIFDTIPEAKNYGIVVGDHAPYNNIGGFLIIRSHHQGDKSESQIIDELNQKVKSIPTVNLGAANHNMLQDVGDGGSNALSFVIQSTGSYQSLSAFAQRFLEKIKKNPHIINPVVSLHINKPDFNIIVNRNKASALGLTMKSITDALSNFFSSPRIGWFALNGYSYPVIPTSAKKHEKQPLRLTDIDLRTGSGKLVSLADVAHYKENISSLELTDFQGLHAAYISASLTKNYTLGQAVKFLESTANQMMPKYMKYDFSGQTRAFIESNMLMPLIFGGCALIIYFLLVLNFNSFIDPLIVLTGAPLSILGALLALYMRGFTLNIYTQIGLMMLIGLISKHGILIVAFANEAQRQGSSIRDAIIEAATTRLKPILMTTIAMVFGAIPLIFAQGVGHESLQQIGTVIVFGLGLGSLMTILVVPCMYLLIAKRLKPRTT